MASETVTMPESDGEWLLDGWRLDVAVTVLSGLMMLGVAADARNHATGISFAEEGFVTPSHVFFYSMFLGVAAVMAAATYRERRLGSRWIDAVPDGYGWTVIGVLVFGFGGFGDFLWHSTFGFEESIEALVSPTHMLLAIGAIMFVATPLRATLRRDRRPDTLVVIPTVLSAGLVLSVLALFGGYVNPLADPEIWNSGHTSVAIGLPGFAVFPAVLVGVGYLLVSRFDLPFGSLGLCFAFPGLVSISLSFHPILVVPPIVTGLIGDAIAAYRRPTADDPVALRGFGLGIGLTFGLWYVFVARFVAPIGWSVHVWSGAIVTAACGGLLVTYVITPDGKTTSHEATA